MVLVLVCVLLVVLVCGVGASVCVTSSTCVRCWC